MNSSTGRRPLLNRAVYLTMPGGITLAEPSERALVPGTYPTTRGLEVARWLNGHGAMVFLDESSSLEQPEDDFPPQLPLAIGQADELVVVVPAPPAGATTPSFRYRDTLVVALTVAFVREIDTHVLLPDGVTPEAVRSLPSAQLPPFLTRGEMKTWPDWGKYSADLRRRAWAVHKPAELWARPLPVCVCVIDSGRHPDRAQKWRQKFTKSLSAYGLAPHVVEWLPRDGTWQRTSMPVYTSATAVAVCILDPSQAPWDVPEFRSMVEGHLTATVVHVGTTFGPLPLPDYLQHKPRVECSENVQEGELLAITRALIGFRDFRSAWNRAPAPRTEPTRYPTDDRATSLERFADGYAVYCRLVFEEETDTNQVAAAFTILQDVVKACAAVANGSARNSIYGSFLVVEPKVSVALGVAEQILTRCAERGVRLAIGIASGSAEDTRDVIGTNVIGKLLITAARLARLEGSTGRIATDVPTREQAIEVSVNFRGDFGDQRSGVVKKTDLNYHWYKTFDIPLGTQRVQATKTAQPALIVAYDLIGFSQGDSSQLARRVEDLTRTVNHAIDAAGLRDLYVAKKLQHVSTGDGGVIVLPTGPMGRGSVLLSFIERLLDYDTVDVRFRVGAAAGQIVFGDNMPVGVAIFEADRCSELAERGTPCVKQSFWDRVEEPTRRNWTERPHSSEKPDYLLIRRNDSTSLPPPSAPL